ncbi:MAG: cation:proton antiporter [Bacteroidales bacterium]|jgi:CPA1 family monovalent cation:H+ antiporter|nr:cation:proton antiporter [Bacteroidales bacterium]
MDSYFAVIILLLLAIFLSPIASKMKIPYPVVLLLAGIAVGFIPNYEPIEINPEVVFLIFLPPMLFDAAIHTNVIDFRHNFTTISLLAIGLVFLTTTAIAVVAHYCIDGMSWSLSFVLGAVLSPPDAIAAIGVTKGLGLSSRANSILEGESLINDASALVAVRFATVAVAGSAFVVWKAWLMFLVVIFGGVAVGLIIWHFFAWVIKRNWLSDEVISVLSLMIPFITYIIAEQFSVSGVIAVVTTGLMIAIKKTQIPHSILTHTKANLDTIIFVLSAIVFILIGLSFPSVAKELSPSEILPLIGWSFLIFFVALVVRMGVLFYHNNSINRRAAKLSQWNKTRNENQTPLSLKDHRRIARVRLAKRQKPLTIKDSIIIGWSGMRGIVSLAAVLSLPLLMDDGSAFPMREEILFLTVCVVIIMLTVQGLGLPLLMKLLHKWETPEESIDSNTGSNSNI